MTGGVENSLPIVTLVVPIRNESVYVERGLSAIIAQDYPLDHMEVLIADGMSTDNTRQIVCRLKALYPHISIRILDNPSQIVSTGINIGLQNAIGDIIIRVDGHTVVAPDYVRQCVEALQRSGAENVGGRMNAIGETRFGKSVAMGTSTPFGIGGGRFHYSNDEEWVDTVYMGAWPRRVFESIGLFDEELVRDQDDEFNYRLRANGGKILLSPNVKSKYTVRSTPRSLWRQYFQYGLYKVRVLQKHPRQMRPHQFIPPLFVLAMLVSMLLSFFPATRFLSLVVPAVYLCTNLAASVWITIRASKDDFSLIDTYYVYLPLTFTILHISYGIGFLLGMFKFWNRWGDKAGRVPTLRYESV